MPDSSPATPSATATRRSGGGISGLLATALVLTVVCALCLGAVLVAAAGGHVLWSGFTLFPAVFLPVAFLLLCVELVRGARRRSAR